MAIGQDARRVQAPGLIHERFFAIARERPSAIALRTSSRELTFAELAAGACELAAALDASGVPLTGRVVISACDHGVVAAALLAVLARGGVVVPLEDTAGAERLARMLASVRPAAYIVDGERAAHLPRDGAVRIVRDEVVGTGPAIVGATDPDAPCSIYFTSGSTGAPRAIVGRAIGIDHHVAWEIEALALDATTRGAIVHTIGYDAYLPDLLVPICAGGTAFAPPRAMIGEPELFIDWLARAEISLLHCTPSRWRELVARDAAARLGALRHVVLAGEVVRPADVAATLARFDGVQLWNLYGPTEATLVKLHHRITAADAERASVPIGRPMPGVTVHLLDDHGAPCAGGEVGQIAIQSRFASHGYLDEPALTAERFLPVPERAGEVMYLTGDLGMRDASGALLFCGRRDRQIKLHGARVDLDEIEAILSRCDGVVEAAAVVDADHTAVFAFVSTDGTAMARIRQQAAASLSAAMRVARLDHVRTFPRTASGKIDRVALARTLEETV
ncbi:MAG: AMP-binding protein [Kofleriaceae bacterium]